MQGVTVPVESEDYISESDISAFASQTNAPFGGFSSDLFGVPDSPVSSDGEGFSSPEISTIPSMNTSVCDWLVRSVCTLLTEAASMSYGKERSTRVCFLFESLIYIIEPECMIRLYGSVETQSTQRYYEIISRRFGNISENNHIKEIGDVKENLSHFFPSLRSNPYFPQLFALLFHRWVFLHSTKKTGLTKQIGLFLKGVNRLFWMDLETGRTCFKSIFQFLKNEILLHQDVWFEHHQIFKYLKPLFVIISKFLFYYETAEALAAFLGQITYNIVLVARRHQRRLDKELVGENSLSHMISCLDEADSERRILIEAQEVKDSLLENFIQIVTRHCTHMRNEVALVNYLRSFGIFYFAKLEGKESALIFTTLQTFCNPGGPLYPPKSVRNAANESLCECFPYGKWVRAFIKFGFRMMHPIRATQIFCHYLLSFLAFVQRTILFFLHGISFFPKATLD